MPKNKKLIAFIFILNLICLLPGLESTASGDDFKNSGVDKIIIFHVNDAHGEINNFPQLAAVVNQAREEYPVVLLLSAGDMFSGNVVVDRFSEPGHPMIDLMNQIQFDAMAIGNHEFDYGQEVLQSRMEQAQFPMLCGNLSVTTGTIQKPPAFIRFETIGGVDVVIFGLLNINTYTKTPNTDLAKIKGIQFYDEYTAFDRYLELLEADLFIILSHLGLERDIELAKYRKGIDIIIGGHSHKEITNLLSVNGTIIVQAGKDLKKLGRVEIDLKEGQVIECKQELIDLESLEEENDHIRKIVSIYQANPWYKQELAILDIPIEGKAELGYLMADAIRHSLNLDIAFQNVGGVRLHSLEGVITVSDIYELEPFDNEIIKFDLTPSEIRSFILTNTFKDSGVNLYVSGINYIVNVANNELISIELTDYNGQSLEEDKIYSVGMNEYMANRYVFEYPVSGKETNQSVVSAIMKYIQETHPLNYKDVSRVRYNYLH